jgi:HAD superfamily hydrolase (TIGR01509 family)
VYRAALLAALRDLGAEVTDEAFHRAYDACRRLQEGSFKARLAERFLGPAADVREVERRASRHWLYPSGSLEPDVAPALEALRSMGYQLGVIANQPSAVREALARDGILGAFELWIVSEDLGLEKPDPRIFAHAVAEAGVPASACAMIGDRLDYDIRPARAAGMHAVWVLRGEAPDEPTPEQLAEADAAIASLADLPGALEGV